MSTHEPAAPPPRPGGARPHAHQRAARMNTRYRRGPGIRRDFTAHGRYGPISGTEYENGTVAYRLIGTDPNQETGDAALDLEALFRVHQVDRATFTYTTGADQ